MSAIMFHVPSSFVQLDRITLNGLKQYFVFLLFITSDSSDTLELTPGLQEFKVLCVLKCTIIIAL